MQILKTVCGPGIMCASASMHMHTHMHKHTHMQTHTQSIILGENANRPFDLLDKNQPAGWVGGG